MNQDSPPITPPPELVDQWRAMPEYADISEKLFSISITTNKLQDIATQAARWGADQELNACCEWLDEYLLAPKAAQLRAARRPKPPSLKEQALEALDQADNGLTEYEWPSRHDIIRRALESLP